MPCSSKSNVFAICFLMDLISFFSFELIFLFILQANESPKSSFMLISMVLNHSATVVIIAFSTRFIGAETVLHLLFEQLIKAVFPPIRVIGNPHFLQ